jgi:hypothetical protein
VAPQLSGGWQHNYSTKTMKAGCANGQSMYSLMSMDLTKALGDCLFHFFVYFSKVVLSLSQ